MQEDRPVRSATPQTPEEEDLFSLEATALEAAPNPIILRDNEERIIYWNKGAESVYLWNKSEAIGQRFLRAKNVMDLLTRIKTDAVEPQKIAALLHLIKEDLGYQLHQSVQAVKYDLSNELAATFRFHDGTVDVLVKVKRSSFEAWIAEELKQIESCLDSLLSASGVDPRNVDAVFLTGGSSFVPAVRRIFATRFGEQRIRTGNQFTSVAWGLALRAATVEGVGSVKAAE